MDTAVAQNQPDALNRVRLVYVVKERPHIEEKLMSTVTERPRNSLQFLLAGLMFTAAILAPWYLRPGIDWIVVVAVMLVFLATLGSWISDRPAGVLINERNLM